MDKLDRMKETADELLLRLEASGSDPEATELARRLVLLLSDKRPFTAEDVRALREETGSSLHECCRALEQSFGNYEVAKEWVRTAGLC